MCLSHTTGSGGDEIGKLVAERLGYLYLDEDITPTLAVRLRSLGYDVVSAHDTGARGISDDEQLRRASAEDRALLSGNFSDFIPIARRAAAEHREHAGIIVVYRRYSRKQIEDLVADVVAFLDIHSADTVRNACFVLPSTTSR